MHILCLHGAGSNSRVFEIQTAAIRYELGDNHTYDFIEGNIPAPMQPGKPHSPFSSSAPASTSQEPNVVTGIELIATKDESMYAYFDEKNPESGVAAYGHLEELLYHEGPYDGVIAFSQAGTLILTYLAHLAKQKPDRPLPFRFAIILSITHPPLDYGAIQSGEIRPIDLGAHQDVVRIPTAHIWGSQDLAAGEIAVTNTICAAGVRWVYVHAQGHDIPRAGARSDVTQTVHVIRRVIDAASKAG